MPIRFYEETLEYIVFFNFFLFNIIHPLPVKLWCRVATDQVVGYLVRQPNGRRLENGPLAFHQFQKNDGIAKIYGGKKISISFPTHGKLFRKKLFSFRIF